MSTLRSAVLRIAYAQPELRKHLLPLLRAASDLWHVVKVNPLGRDNADDSHFSNLGVALKGPGGERKYLTLWYDFDKDALVEDISDISVRTTTRGGTFIINLAGGASSHISRGNDYEWEAEVEIDLQTGEFVGVVDRRGMLYLPIKLKNAPTWLGAVD